MKEGWEGARRTGFTIIEVMLFLAISGFLLVGILVGTGSGIARQRYNDSVQDVAQVLREQYSAVMNVQIPERGENEAWACYSPSVDEVLAGNDKITSDALSMFFNPDGNLKVSGGRGRTSCLVYGVMITLGGDDGRVIQTSSLIGKDVKFIEEDIAGKHDLEVLKSANLNNLNVFYDIETDEEKTEIRGWECWVRTTSGSARHNVQWEARLETPEQGNEVLQATIIIVRSPWDGAIRTYVMRGALKDSTGAIVNYADINRWNGGKGWGLLSRDSGDCGGTVHAGQGGYGLLRDASVNSFLTTENFVETELRICVGSRDMFAFAGQRRMIKLAAGGHNASAVELVKMDEPENEEDRCG